MFQPITEAFESMASKFKSQLPSTGSTVRPAKRFMPPDMTAPVFADLVNLALLRVFDVAFSLQTRPSRLFPTAESVFGGYYTHDDWLFHGDLETEMGRMSYMLSNLPERGIPTACVPTIKLVLSSASVLTTWKRSLPQLKWEAGKEVQWIIDRMQKQRRFDKPYHQKSDFIAIPVDCETSISFSGYATQLWLRSLSEIVVQICKGHYEQAKTFLQIFAFLKDPLGGLGGVSERAVELFVYILASLAESACQTPDISTWTRTNWHAAVAQAAQEALFLANPLLVQIDYIHFTGHQQLPYVYVALDRLPRSEFSIPEHVLYIIEEVLTTNHSPDDHDCCAIAPISVSSYPALPIGQEEQITVIIDGNHRATAIMVLRLIAEYPAASTASETNEMLNTFCTDHRLGQKWRVDLAEVLQALHGSRCSVLVQDQMRIVKQFRDMETIPALVVREDQFFTVCQQRKSLEDRPRLLLPIHQALYNDEELNLAFPQAGQVHGRAIGFKKMPLVRSKIANPSEVTNKMAEMGDFLGFQKVIGLERGTRKGDESRGEDLLV